MVVLHRTAVEVEELVESLGVVPATIGILDGKVHVGTYVPVGTGLPKRGSVCSQNGVLIFWFSAGRFIQLSIWYKVFIPCNLHMQLFVFPATVVSFPGPWTCLGSRLVVSSPFFFDRLQ